MVFVSYFIFAVLAAYFSNWLLSPGLWWRAWSRGVPIGLLDLMRLRLGGVEPDRVLGPLLLLADHDIRATLEQFLSHYRSGGELWMVAMALEDARDAGIPLSVEHACAINLAGYDVAEVVLHAWRQQLRDFPAPPPETGKRVWLELEGPGREGLRFWMRLFFRMDPSAVLGGDSREEAFKACADAIRSAAAEATSAEAILADPATLARSALDEKLRPLKGYIIDKIDLRIEILPG